MSVGVIVMVVLMVVAFCSSQGQGLTDDVHFGSSGAGVSLPALPPAEDEPSAPTPEVAVRTPAPPAVPGLSPRSTDLPRTPQGSESPEPTEPTPARSPRPSRPAQASGQPSPDAPRSEVTGRYGVVGNYGDAFIGELRLTNAGSGSEPWQVRLVYPQGRLVTAWVESAEQGRGSMSDGVFSYVGGVDLPPGGSAVLRFHLERTGPSTRPVRCTVNGSPCSGG
ncbi:hypothetical protein AWW66_14590 [Micromonospora rosaria]|uniref:CBM2 domain-containing protein n=2 Tax=Micromonospora rosaria TaxID=47874 RepID=A0A136PS34_9ACTN|nr:hypothetical protein AWW66_14590 [Micromonospora rosaria]